MDGCRDRWLLRSCGWMVRKWENTSGLLTFPMAFIDWGNTFELCWCFQISKGCGKRLRKFIYFYFSPNCYWNDECLFCSLRLLIPVQPQLTRIPHQISYIFFNFFSLPIFLFFLHFYWSISDWHCSVHFCYTAKWISCESLSCVLLFMTPLDCSPSGSFAHGILQARILEWVVILFSRESSWPMDWTQVSCPAGRFFTKSPGKPESVTHTSTYIHTYPKRIFFRFFPHTGDYRVLSRFPCALQWVLISYELTVFKKKKSTRLWAELYTLTLILTPQIPMSNSHWI